MKGNAIVTIVYSLYSWRGLLITGSVMSEAAVIVSNRIGFGRLPFIPKREHNQKSCLERDACASTGIQDTLRNLGLKPQACLWRVKFGIRGCWLVPCLALAMLASKDVSPCCILSLGARFLKRELRLLVVPPIFGVAPWVTEPRSFDSQSLPGMLLVYASSSSEELSFRGARFF